MPAACLTALMPWLVGAAHAENGPNDSTVIATANAYGALLEADYSSIIATTGAARASAHHRVVKLAATASDNSVSAEALATAKQFVADDQAAGVNVTGADVTTDVLDSTTAANGTVTADVDISTTLQVDDNDNSIPDTSDWSDTHQLTMTPDSHGNLHVAKDVYETEPADDTPDDATGPATDPPKQTAVGHVIPEPARVERRSAVASQSVKATKGFPTETKISPSDFDAYAKTWTTGSHKGESAKAMNSKYPHFNNNCANFASQVLDNSGWWLTGGDSLQVKDLTKWTYNLAGIAGATRTWSKASDLYVFAANTGTYQWLDLVDHAHSGDLLFVSWDPKGKPDDDIDHVMVVCGVGKKGRPLISQKSHNRHNITIDQVYQLARKQGRTKINWYGLQHVS